MPASAGSRSEVVELTVPADPAYVAVVRTATAGLAARLDLTLDRIEDLRIAVDEACTLLVRRTGRHPVPSGTDEVISCVYSVSETGLSIVVTGPPVELPEPSAYAWSVLSALVDLLESGHHEGADGAGHTWLRLDVQSGLGPSGGPLGAVP